MTKQIADFLMERLQPRGVGVVDRGVAPVRRDARRAQAGHDHDHVTRPWTLPLGRQDAGRVLLPPGTEATDPMTGSSKPRTPRMAQPIGKPSSRRPSNRPRSRAGAEDGRARAHPVIDRPARAMGARAADVDEAAPRTRRRALPRWRRRRCDCGGATPADYPTTMKEVFARVDPAWAGFRAAAARGPASAWTST